MQRLTCFKQAAKRSDLISKCNVSNCRGLSSDEDLNCVLKGLWDNSRSLQPESHFIDLAVIITSQSSRELLRSGSTRATKQITKEVGLTCRFVLNLSDCLTACFK